MYNLITLIMSVGAIALFTCFKRGRRLLKERMGFWTSYPSQPVYWLHVASLGEYRGIVPLVDRIRASNSPTGILLTATSAQVVELAQAEGLNAHLLPFDSSLYIRKVLRHLSVIKLIVAETELWPGLYAELKKIGVPISIVNGRISDYSIRGYKALSWFFPELLKNVRIFAADEISAGRFIELGAQAENVKISGNMKFDTSISMLPTTEIERLKKQWFGDCEPLITLGSLRPQEETFWFPAIKDKLDSGFGFNLVVAPRHLERVEYFANQLDRFKIGYQRKSSGVSSKVILLDSIGELQNFYHLSDLAFIGATLVNVGGHNPLEAAALAVPIVMGPFRNNIRDIAADLIAAGGAFQVETAEDVSKLLDQFFSSRILYQQAGSKAAIVAEKHRGATARVYDGLFSE